MWRGSKVGDEHLFVLMILALLALLLLAPVVVARAGAARGDRWGLKKVMCVNHTVTAADLARCISTASPVPPFVEIARAFSVALFFHA